MGQLWGFSPAQLFGLNLRQQVVPFAKQTTD
jgi:hypothetical protein